MLKHILLRSARYNIWANTRVTNACLSIPRSILDKHLGGSFPSITSTLVHIHNAEYIWLWRLSGSAGTPAPIGHFVGDLGELATRLLVQSNSLLEFVQNIDPELLTRPIPYRNLGGQRNEHSPEQILMHVVNHSSYHRGQVINYLRQEGIESVPSTDMILFMRHDP